VLATLIVLAIACVAALMWFDLAIGIVMTCVAGVFLLGLYVLSRNKFGGMSGDLAGFFLQMCELALLVSIVVTCNVMAM
jgi:adenosylcobinamide-GDP ribazoletransferase